MYRGLSAGGRVAPTEQAEVVNFLRTRPCIQPMPIVLELRQAKLASGPGHIGRAVI